MLYDYQIGGQPLTRTDTMEDLGIIISPDLKWGPHISKMCKKACRQLWLIPRTLSYQALVPAKKTAYLALVRSVLDYGISLWTPHTKELIKTVESVQCKATNFILCNPRYDSPNHIDYKTRLLTLNLLPTTFRREITDLTLFLKSIHGQTNLDITQYTKFIDRDIGPHKSFRSSDQTQH